MISKDAVFAQCVLLFAATFVQVIWARRGLRQAEAWWQDNSHTGSLAWFAKVNAVITAFWMLLAVGLTYVALDAPVIVGIQAAGDVLTVCLSFAVWSLGHGLLSFCCRKVSRDALSLERVRQLSASSESDLRAWLPEGFVSSHVDPSSISQLFGRLRGGANFLFAIHCTILAIVILVGVSHMADVANSGALQMLVVVLVLIVPTFAILTCVRSMVGVRARQAQFLWFLATTVEKQRPIAKELRHWSEANVSRFSSGVSDVAACLDAGHSLSDSLRGRRVLSENDVLTIRVAEQTGRLSQTLRDLAIRGTNTLRGDPQNDAAIGMALYLWALITTGFCVVAFLMYSIVPKFKAIFQGFGTELPGITVAMINILESAAAYGAIYIVFVPLSSFVVKTVYQAYFRGWSETTVASWLGVTRRAEIPRLLRRLRDAVRSHAPWLVVLQPLVREHHRQDVRVPLERVLGRVSTGLPIWPALQEAGLLTSRDKGLLELAERAGNLDWALTALADSKERHMQHRWRVIQTLLLPAFILIGGVVVLFVCVGFFMPLVKLLNDLS